MSFRELLGDVSRMQPAAARIESRDLLATDFNTGGSFIGEKVVTTVDALREDSLVARLKPTVTQQAEGDVTAPAITAGVTAYWLESGEACPASDLTTAKGKLSPRRVGARVLVSKQLLIQSPLFETQLKADLRKALGEALDDAILGGLGGGGQPLGLLHNQSIPSVTFGGAATAAKLEEFSYAVREAKVSGPLAWVFSPRTASKFRTTAGVAGVNTLWQAAGEIGSQEESNFADDHLAILGRWSDLWLHEWGVFLESNPYTYAPTGQVEINANLYVNFAPLRTGAFCRSTDAANQ